jgi:hypothetical protein
MASRTASRLSVDAAHLAEAAFRACSLVRALVWPVALPPLRPMRAMYSVMIVCIVCLLPANETSIAQAACARNSKREIFQARFCWAFWVLKRKTGGIA